MSGRGKAVAGTVVTAAVCVAGACSAAMKTKPNIIVVLTDDQGFGQLPVYSDVYPDEMLFLCNNTERYKCDVQKAKAAAKASMPNLQKMAANGVVFMNAHVTSPVCGPSRAALMTGRYQQRFGIYDNIDLSNGGVPATETFLPALLKKAGYRTGMIGKWHLGRYTKTLAPVQTRDYHKNATIGCVPEDHPLNRGFDYYFGFNGSGTSYYDSPSLFRGFEHIQANGYLTDEFTDESLRFIDSCKAVPFFLYLAYNAPHIPLEARAPEQYQRFNTGNPEVDNYYAYLAAVDHGLGRILKKLEDAGQLENTLIVYLSDNGAVIDSPQPMNGPYQGNKGQFRLGGTHVPMIAYWPAVLKSAKFEPRVASIDVLPTALAAAGAAVPSNADGVDLLPHLKAGTVAHETLFWAGPEILHWGEPNKPFWKGYWEYITERRDDPPQSVLTAGEAGWGVLKGPWLLRCNEVQGIYTLCNVTNDISEQKNVAAEHPEVVQELKKAYGNWASGLGAPFAWSQDQYKLLMKDVHP